MPLALLPILALLLVMLAFAVHMAFSGFLVGRTGFGWTFLLVYLLIYFPFATAWFTAMGLSLGSIFHVVFMLFMVMPLAPFVAELITLQFMPDPSRGLKLLLPHTEAEKKVIQDDLTGAIEEYEKVLEETPNDMDARLRMAELCIEIKQYEKAAKVYETALKKSPKLAVERHCFVLTRLSEIYGQHLGNPEKAYELAHTIIERYPDSSYAKFAKERLSDLGGGGSPLT